MGDLVGGSGALLWWFGLEVSFVVIACWRGGFSGAVVACDSSKS